MKTDVESLLTALAHTVDNNHQQTARVVTELNAVLNAMNQRIHHLECRVQRPGLEANAGRQTCPHCHAFITDTTAVEDRVKRFRCGCGDWTLNPA